ncbi:UDP-glucose dehydrogenase family protein [Actinomadura opuntiae]|uniref:UDP-glucose dehydrogenase family protein n=1 Tax=Actinomadura sp. OS1-43 TaxID=604315 RepID=UPI00255A9552|nr:UDP-glucose/GDP-mannose dehydrogenase family protein [Actinomadura sp. OS1-43]MDL4813516.1 UDP-glucose/GDP-mannose dehydrogenase family protein [Actinomadura sp. OS1-43]
MNPTESPRLTVIGTGYLGATHAICMAVLGFEVLGVDVDQRKVDKLASGEVPFFEPGLPELLSKALESGRLRFTTSFQEAGEFGDVHFLCVGTPQQPGSDAADLTYVDAAVRALAPTLTRRALVVGKSTVPVGTARRLTDLIHELAPAGEEVELAWNPEFLREGFAVDDTMRPDRLVFGVESEWAEERLRAAFKPILEQQGTPVVRTDLATAELVKVAANSFLATKISYINAMAEVCEAVGADIKHLADSLALDDRIGGKFLKPGLGFGGGCLPKDIRAFAHRAEELGVGQAVSFLREVDDINRRRRARTVDLVREMLGGISGKRIAAWGAAFKPNSDDIRDAPALDVARTMHGLGGHVRVFDPAALDNARRAFPELRYGDSAIDVARDAEVVVLLTEWSEFKEIDPDALAQVVKDKRIVDGRHALDADKWRAAGWEYRALGRS